MREGGTAKREREKGMAMAASIKEFLLGALREEQRLDGRKPFEYRRLTIKFAREDGAAEVQLGQTRVLCIVSCLLVQPYPDQPNEGILAIYTEFSPMADPMFEGGRPSENAVELGRIIDRGLRESRAIDTESLCVLSGKAVWSLRIDICILDNGGNLIDAASMAALAALLTFRRPECSIAGIEGCDVVIHPPEVREPVPLILHYLPIAFTFGIFEDGDLLVVDPSYKEELLMRGKFTVILNGHGEICAIQKGGGVGITSGNILHCLQIASTKVADITASLKKAVEAHEIERAQRKIKRQQKLCCVAEDATLVEDMDIMKGVQASLMVHEKAVVSQPLSSSESDSSSVGSLEDSSEEEVMASRPGRVPKQDDRRAMEQQRLPPGKEADETSSVTSVRLHGEEVQSSFTVEHGGDPGHTMSTPDKMSSVVSQRLERIGIHMSTEAGRVEESRASSSSKTKPGSLLDAIKWNNVKKKRAG